MFDRRTAARESLLLIAFTGLFGPAYFAVFALIGVVAWALVGEWVVRYQDQYEWFAGCVSAGYYCGFLGIPACAVRWVRHRLRPPA